MENDCSKSFNTGIIFGVIMALVCVVVYFVLVINPYYSIDLIPKETSMTERVRYISGQWDDCWLSIGEDDNALYWKCDRFSSRIGYYICEEKGRDTG